jgi:uncharacterized RDD family membrane protein YckC
MGNKVINEPSNTKKIEPSRRLIALLIDLIACFLAAVILSTAISLIPFVNSFFFLNRLFSQQLCLVFLFMCRDYFFSGRGIGKNLMGLRVVSDIGELPISLKQSLLRNLTLTLPMLFLELTSLLPIAWLPSLVRDIFNVLEACYAIVVFPLESYRAYSHEDSLRLGDILAQTHIVESQTDFDNFLSRQKN